VLVAREAADTPEFLDVVNDVVRAIPGLCASESRTAKWKENGKVGHVELVIPDAGRMRPPKESRSGCGQGWIGRIVPRKVS
jgi:hypothetical protein